MVIPMITTTHTTMVIPMITTTHIIATGMTIIIPMTNPGK